ERQERGIMRKPHLD
nr:hypothetical protein [Tanacetum cinerariifolium]